MENRKRKLNSFDFEVSRVSFGLQTVSSQFCQNFAKQFVDNHNGKVKQVLFQHNDIRQANKLQINRSCSTLRDDFAKGVNLRRGGKGDLLIEAKDRIRLADSVESDRIS